MLCRKTPASVFMSKHTSWALPAATRTHVSQIATRSGLTELGSGHALETTWSEQQKTDNHIKP